MDTHSYLFPAIRGVQAGHEYYSVMCPLRLVARILVFDEEGMPPDLRAQRVLNRARVPEIADYIVRNKTEYVFSSLTASIDGQVTFTPWDNSDGGRSLGHLTIPMNASMIINDGQHRRAAIEAALKDCPELGDESISVVFFVDRGLKRSQQIFADLNKHAVRPTRSLGIYYDYRDPLADIARELAETVPAFKGLTEFEKATLSNRSSKLFTLSGIYYATRALLGAKSKHSKVTQKQAQLAQQYWTVLSQLIPEWRMAVAREVSCAELRANFIHAHAVSLHALGLAGAALISTYPDRWTERAKPLGTIDWRRSNSKLWEGRAMVGGHMSKAHNNVLLTSGVIKKHLGLRVTPEEAKLERSHRAAS